jgi:hypothetical protein
MPIGRSKATRTSSLEPQTPSLHWGLAYEPAVCTLVALGIPRLPGLGHRAACWPQADHEATSEPMRY